MNQFEPQPEVAVVCSQLSYTPAQAAIVTGRSRTRIFEALKNKELSGRKDGKATLIEACELLRWIRSMPVVGRRPG